MSPPWLHDRDCNGVRQLTGGRLPSKCSNAFVSASPEPRRAHALRSWCVCDDRVRMCGKLSLEARFLKPRRVHARRSWCTSFARR